MSKVTLKSSFRFDGKAYPANKAVELPTDALKIAKANKLIVDTEEAEAKAKEEAEAKANKSKGNAPKNK